MTGVTFLELLSSANVSARLSNCIRRAHRDRSIPYTYVDDFLAAGANSLDFRVIPEFGRKTQAELDELIRQYLAGELELITQQTNFSDRFLKDLVINQSTDGELIEAFETDTYRDIRISDYLIDRTLIRLSWRGRRLLAALVEDYIQDGGVIGSTDNEEVRSTNDDHDSASEVTRECNIQDCTAHLRNSCTEKEWFVLQCRGKRLTLKRIGEHLKVTRERVRQIEKKAYQKLKKTNRILLSGLSQKLDEMLDENFGEIEVESLPSRFNINGLNDLVTLNVLLGECREETVLTRNGCISRTQENLDVTEWNDAIERTFTTSQWPVSVSDLAQAIPDVPEAYVERYLEKFRRAKIDREGNITDCRLKVSERIAYALRSIGREATPSEVARAILNLFNVNMTAHAVGATLGRMDDALIVRRGTYALYDFLDISSDQLDSIRSESAKHLNERSSYISTKILYEELLNADKIPCAVESDYMLHGILQDDDRFSIRRGLMVALRDTTGSLVSFTPLSDEVHDLVEQRGPISIAEIKLALSSHRKLLDVNIATALRADPDVIKVSTGRYDLASRVFGESKSTLEIGLTIIVLESPSTLYDISTKLRTIPSLKDKPLNKSVITWSLDRQGVQKKDGNIYAATTKDSPIYEYLDYTSSVDFSTISKEELTNNLPKSFGHFETADLIYADFRMYTKSLHKAGPNVELKKILGSFGI